MSDFIKWLEEEVASNFLSALLFILTTSMLAALWVVSVYITYGLTIVLPVVYFLVKYLWNREND